MKRLATVLIALFCVLGLQAQYDRQQILKVYNWDEYIGVGNLFPALNTETSELS